MDEIRRLVVVRHAKAADSANASGNDVDRPLTSRGERDAAAAGHWLAAQDWTLGRVLCSPAKRAQQTWTAMGRGLRPVPALVAEPRLYNASGQTLLDVLREQDDSTETLAVVGHNPGVQRLAVLLAGGGEPDALQRLREKFPTCAVAVLTVAGSWAGLAEGIARLEELVVPRS